MDPLKYRLLLSVGNAAQECNLYLPDQPSQPTLRGLSIRKTEAQQRLGPLTSGLTQGFQQPLIEEQSSNFVGLPIMVYNKFLNQGLLGALGTSGVTFQLLSPPADCKAESGALPATCYLETPP